jgi:hypothetical protein
MRASRESFGGGWNEAMIFRDGEFVISRFALKEAAIRMGDRATRRHRTRVGGMILTPTVLVLGAGASQHLNFPLGGQLKVDVCQALLEKTRTVRRCIGCCAMAGRAADELNEFANALRRSRQPSIDLFVEPDVHQPWRPLAREVIAAALIPYERDSVLENSGGWYE